MLKQIQLLIVSVLFLACAAPASADRLILRYDADNGKYPEEEGWTRWPGDPPEGGGVTRTVEDGVFRINSLASPSIADFYWFGGAELMPGPGEFLRVDWRMRVLRQDLDVPDVPYYFGDAGIHISRSGNESALF